MLARKVRAELDDLCRRHRVRRCRVAHVLMRQIFPQKDQVARGEGIDAVPDDPPAVAALDQRDLDLRMEMKSSIEGGRALAQDLERTVGPRNNLFEDEFHTN